MTHSLNDVKLNLVMNAVSSVVLSPSALTFSPQLPWAGRGVSQLSDTAGRTRHCPGELSQKCWRSWLECTWLRWTSWRPRTLALSPPVSPPSLLGLPVSHSVRFSPTDLVTVLDPGLGRARHPERPGQHHLATSEHAAPALIMALGQMLPFIAKLVLFCLHSSTWSRSWSRNVSFLPASPSIFQGWLP